MRPARTVAPLGAAQGILTAMRFNPLALLVLVGFFALLAMALSSGSATMHLAEAGVTVLIAIGLGGYAFRGQRQR